MKRRHPRAQRALFLLVAASASATLQLSHALAQPAPAKVGKSDFQLPPDRKDTFRKFVDLSNLENVCKLPLDLKVKDATLDDVIANVKKVIPAKTLIEVRAALPVRVTFDLHDTTVGEALGSVGSLAGCKLWVFPDRVLLAPPMKLSALEQADVDGMMGGEWIRNVAAGGSGWTAQGNGKREMLLTMAEMFDQQLAKTPVATGGVQGQPTAQNQSVATFLFGDLSPDAQAIMRQLIQWINESSHDQNAATGLLTLSPNTKVIYNYTNPHDVGIDMRNPLDSDAKPPWAGWGFTR